LERILRVYRRFARFYGAFRTVWGWSTRAIELELDQLFRDRIGPDSRILELGPGTGINIGRLMRCARGFRSYLGFDASEEMLAKAERIYGSDGRIELRIGDATDLKQVRGSFDFVVSTWMLSHLDAPATTVREALAKLAPRGSAVFVFLTTPRWKPVRGALRALGDPFSYEFVDPEPIRELPGLERLHTCAGGMATLVVFRALADRTPGE